MVHTSTIPTALHRTRAPIAALAMLAGAFLVGCSEAHTAPDRMPPVRLVTSATVASKTATAVRADVMYHRIQNNVTTSIVLDTAHVDLTGQTDQMAIDLDIGPCLNDPDHEKPQNGDAKTCVLYVRLQLLDASGGVMDTYNSGAIPAAPGQITSTPPALLGTPAAAVRVTPANDTLRAIGSAHQLTAVVLDSSGHAIDGATATFTSLDPAIVTVTTDGYAQSVTTGVARLIATNHGATDVSDTFNIVVRQIAANATGQLRDALIATGDTSSYVITAEDSAGVAIPAGGYSYLRFTSGDATVATVDSLTGLVTGVGVGTTTITAQFRVIQIHTNVTVTGPRAPKQLALGAFHSCRLDDGTHQAQCWGADHFGQLGAGNSARFGTPDTLAGGVRLTSVNGSSGTGLQTCGLDVSGTAYCWGVSLYGVVFDGSLAVQMAPTAVGSGITFTKVVSGSEAATSLQWACGLDTGGQAWCWGDNLNGELGDGTTTAHASPAPVAGGQTFTSLATGNAFTCGLTTTQSVYCWGDGSQGQTGDNSLSMHATPTLVPSLPAITQIAAGGLVACGLDANGNAWCWGNDAQGQMGNGSTTGVQTSPVAAASGQTFSSLTVGFRHTCGITTSGVAKCWGFGDLGQLGDGLQTSEYTPATVSGGITFTSLSAGRRHTCGVASTGAAYCWGSNGFHQLGDGTTTLRSTPTMVAGGHTFTAVSASSNTTCGIATGGTGYCWGTGYDGIASSLVRTPENTFSTLTLGQMAAGIQFTCATTTGGTAYCAGDNSLGMLGDGTGVIQSSPVKVDGAFTFGDLAVASNSACGVTTDGTGLCWGQNSFAQLGDGTTDDRTSPTTVWGGITWRHIVASLTSSCGLSANGAVYCWGLNNHGQLGNGSVNPTALPTPVSGKLTFGSVAVGPLFACGLANGGVAYCWGDNSHGQLGDGTNTDRSVPTAVATNLRFVELDTRGAHVCGITSSGAAYCWGDNFAGQLGDGTTTDRNLPTAVAGAFNFVGIATGAAHSCGVTDQGTTFCWGWNVAGQLGDGTLVNRTTPVQAP